VKLPAIRERVAAAFAFFEWLRLRCAQYQEHIIPDRAIAGSGIRRIVRAGIPGSWLRAPGNDGKGMGVPIMRHRSVLSTLWRPCIRAYRYSRAGFRPTPPTARQRPSYAPASVTATPGISQNREHPLRSQASRDQFTQWQAWCSSAAVRVKERADAADRRAGVSNQRHPQSSAA